MDRTVRLAVPMMLALLPAAQAAEPGFYVAATASRVEQELDRNAGFVPIVVFAPGTPSFNPSPTFPLRPSDPVGGVFAPFRTPDRVAVDDVDAGWSVALGYRVNQYLAAEVAYVDAGEASLTQYYSFGGLPGMPPRESISSFDVNVRGPAVSVLGSYPVSTHWQVFVRGGVLFADQEVQSAITSTAGNIGRFEQTFSDEVLLAGAGVQWSFATRWAARLEYQRTDDLDENLLSGASRIDQASLSVLFSL